MTSRIDRALNVADLRLLAKRRLPKALFEFIDGGSEDEVTVRANREQFARWSLVGRFARDVASRSCEVELFGERYRAPLAISATGLAGLHRGRADVHLARAAQAVGVPFTLAALSAMRIEDVASQSQAPFWFQLQILRDRDYTYRLIERAQAAGCKVLVVTIDCPVPGQRERDHRNGLAIPLRLTWSNVLDMLLHLPWLWDTMRHGAPEPENLREADGGRGGQGLAAAMNTLLDATVTWKDIEAVRRRWNGYLVVKGIVAADDARTAIDLGADGVTVSNHGGRQLDGAVPTLEALPRVVDAVGHRATVLCDSGFRRGSDVAKALALGAKAVCLGRATLFGLAAGGEAGVLRALTILRDELDRVMAMTGCTGLTELNRAVLWDRVAGPGGEAGNRAAGRVSD